MFCFSKVTDTRNVVMLKPVKFRSLGDFTQLAMKTFPQSIFWWSFHTIFPIILGFEAHQIQLYTNLLQVSQKFGSNLLDYLPNPATIWGIKPPLCPLVLFLINFLVGCRIWYLFLLLLVLPSIYKCLLRTLSGRIIKKRASLFK